MKKLLILTCAMAALLSCAKEVPVSESSESFVAGQKVTLYASALGCGTKISSKEGTEGGIVFKWQENDVIRVFVGQAYSDFTLVEGAGSSSGTFEGEMPGSGSDFTVRYPAEGDPLGTTQDYTTEEALPVGNMLFTADNGKIIDNVGSFELKAAYSALKLSFYGKNVQVNSIKATIGGTEYTLNCGADGVDIGDTKADSTSFRLVVPSGSSVIGIKVNASYNGVLYDYEDYSHNYGKGTPLIAGTSFSSSSAKTFTAGQELRMNARELYAVVWAPENCGHEFASGDYKGYTYGKLYQWGRKWGQGYKGLPPSDMYEDADSPKSEGEGQLWNELTSKLTAYPDGGTYNGDFYYHEKSSFEYWYAGTSPDKDKLWSEDKTEYDPCPTHWRVPIKREYADNLLGGGESNGSGWDSEKKGYWFNGTPSQSVGDGIFFTAAGCLNPFANKIRSIGAFDRGETGSYWCSTGISTNPDQACYLTFLASEAGVIANGRSYGFSIRCVQE